MTVHVSAPISLLDVERGTDPSDALAAARHDRLWITVLREGVPQAIVECLRDDARAALDAAVLGRAAAPLPAVPDDELPSITVVVPTLARREEELARCVARLDDLDYPDYEVVLVDNRPRGAGGWSLDDLVAGRDRFRVARAAFPGASAARNAGIAAARGAVVAFTDDDVEVSRGWLRGFGTRFVAEPGLGVLTGLILPAELESQAQLDFELYYGGFAGVRSFARLTLRAGRRLPSRGVLAVRERGVSQQRQVPVYGVGAFGASANMAARREVLLTVGGFDPALGAGTRASGGEDLALLASLAWSGVALGVEPAAWVRHKHRADAEGLRLQMRGYGLGYTAMITALVLRDPRHLLALAWLAGPAATRFVRLNVRRWRGQGAAVQQAGLVVDPRLARIETSAMPRGPIEYLRSRLALRRRTDPATLGDFLAAPARPAGGPGEV